MKSDALSELLDDASPSYPNCGERLIDAGILERIEMVCWHCGYRPKLATKLP